MEVRIYKLAAIFQKASPKLFSKAARFALHGTAVQCLYCSEIPETGLKLGRAYRCVDYIW